MKTAVFWMETTTIDVCDLSGDGMVDVDLQMQLDSIRFEFEIKKIWEGSIADERAGSWKVF
jgi:hypothetical protein